MSYDIYQHIFFFSHCRHHNHFVLRVDWVYHVFWLKKKQNRIPYEHFALNVFPVLNFCRSLFNNFLIWWFKHERNPRQTDLMSRQFIGCTDRPSQGEKWGAAAPLSLLGYANDFLCLWLRRSLYRRLRFIPLFCLLFCPYAYAYVWTRF